MNSTRSLGASCLLALAVIAGIAGIAQASNQAPPDHWWNQKKYIKELELNPEQRQRLDAIAANTQAILAAQQKLDREQTTLTTLLSDAKAEEAKVFAQIDIVKQARIDLQRAALHHNLGLYQVLTPDQQHHFDVLFPPQWMVQ